MCAVAVVLFTVLGNTTIAPFLYDAPGAVSDYLFAYLLTIFFMGLRMLLLVFFYYYFRSY